MFRLILPPSPSVFCDTGGAFSYYNDEWERKKGQIYLVYRRCERIFAPKIK